jgi:hypothetical protein
MKKRNQALHSRIFQKAAEKGEIENVEIEKVSDLYLSTQSGITSLCIMQGNKELFPSKKELKALLEKQMNLCKIFLNGLKNKNQ